MNVIHTFNLDLQHPGIARRLDAVQGDCGSRQIELQLYSGGKPWPIPAGTRILVRYSKPDKTGGEYDTLPNGTCCWSARGNSLVLALAPQVLTVAGTVALAVTMIFGEAQLTTFSIFIDVQRKPGFSTVSENYSMITGFLPQIDNCAQPGQLLQVSRVDASGKVLALEATDPATVTAGGLTAAEKEVLLQLLQQALYASDVSGTLAALASNWGLGEEEEPEEEPEEVVLVSISALYSGGDIPVGTELGWFYDWLSVTAVYSDGSTQQVPKADLTIGGGTIVEGENELYVEYSGLRDTFTVNAYLPTYTAAVTLNNQTTGTSETRSSEDVTHGESYGVTLTVPDGYDLVSVSVTMDGVNVTDGAYANGSVSIASVTGNVVVTMVVAEKATYTVTNTLTNVSTSNASVSAGEGSAYYAELTVSDGYEWKSVTVTMGGTDITASAYSGGTISIASVTGNIVITASAALIEEEAEVTLTGISATYTGEDPVAGTDVTELEGVVVTCHYSDGTSATTDQYMMSGTIEEGTNTIVVSYSGFTASFTVTGVAGVPASCSVTNHMTNATTSTTLPTVVGGAKYVAVITAKEGYTLQSVTVTMGGVDVTADVWNADTSVITIDSVTGDLVITAVAVGYTLVNNWDFTTSLTDTVGGVTAVLLSQAGNIPTRDDDGVHFTVAGQAIQLTQQAQTVCNKRVEIDIASGQFTKPTTQHARIFGVGPDEYINANGACFTWRYNNSIGWTVYKRPGQSWGASLDSEQYPITMFDGKTVRLDFDEGGYLTLSSADIGSSDFTQINTFALNMSDSTFSGVFVIGSGQANELYPATFSGVRIYEKGE